MVKVIVMVKVKPTARDRASIKVRVCFRVIVTVSPRPILGFVLGLGLVLGL
jgi:hypothetical protein